MIDDNFTILIKLFDYQYEKIIHEEESVCRRERESTGKEYGEQN